MQDKQENKNGPLSEKELASLLKASKNNIFKADSKMSTETESFKSTSLLDIAKQANIEININNKTNDKNKQDTKISSDNKTNYL